jgi:hypothetical protein
MNARRMNERLKRGLPLLLALLLLLALAGLAHAATWQIETVDSAGYVGLYPSLALDSSGNPHISYYDYSNGDLKYAAWDGSSWQIETVDSGTSYQGVGLYPSLALDSSDNPHISYFDFTNGDLKYAAWDGSSWQIETVDSAGDVGLYTSLALDSSGNPHISYHDDTNGDLKYAAWDGSSWQIETVDSASSVGEYTSLALDSSGNPHISYYDRTNGDLKYAAWDSSSWQIETVDSAGDVGRYPSLALDSSGNPHISYYDGTNGDLKYAVWDGSSWQIETVDSAGDVGLYTSLALDSSGNPHISYFDNTYLDLKYAAWDGSSWQIETVDSFAFVGYFTSLALDGNGNPHISYLYNTYYDLKYAALIADSTPPAISANVSGTLGDNGWYVSDVTVSWTVTDNESAISSTSGCDPTTINSDTAGTPLNCTATSAGGTNSASVTIQRDATAPSVSASVSPAANANGWNNSDVTVSFSGSDNLSGIASCDADVILSSEGSGQSASGTCTDNAGNVSATATASGINIDKTPPSVNVTGVTDGATYILGSVPSAGCDTSDALSGVATAASLTLSGGNPDGSGTFTATCSGALDKAGNSGSASLTYTVITPQQAITNLENDIQSLVDDGTLKTGQATGLLNPLDNAIRSLDKGYTDDACNQLDDFIAKVNEKTPDPLDAATAAELIASAEAIQTAIGCP